MTLLAKSDGYLDLFPCYPEALYFCEMSNASIQLGQRSLSSRTGRKGSGIIGA
jgi:hypothetical protein